MTTSIEDSEELEIPRVVERRKQRRKVKQLLSHWEEDSDKIEDELWEMQSHERD